MVMVGLVLEAVAQVLAALLGAAALTALLWNLFKRLRHPEWGPCVAVLLVAAALSVWPRIGPVLSMLASFSLLAAVVTWHEGAEWRQRHRR